jgi:putative nucleotidyltransferase with HDIG domain
MVYHAWRWLPLVGLALLTYLAYPVAQGYDVQRTDVEVATADVIAPFDFLVLKTDAEMESEANERAAAARSVYDYREGVTDAILRRVENLFTALDQVDSTTTIAEAGEPFGLTLNEEEAAYLGDEPRRTAVRTSVRRMISDFLTRGVTTEANLAAETNSAILVRRGDTEMAVSVDSVLTIREFLQRRSTMHPDPNSSVGDQVFGQILSQFSEVTLAKNAELTEEARALLRAGVDSVKDRVRATERIIAAHEVMTQEKRDRLNALQQELVNRGGAGGGRFSGIVGQILTNALVVAVFWLLLMLYLPDIYRELRQVLVFAGLFGLVIAGAAANYKFVHTGPELIPAPFAVMLIAVLFNGRIAMVAAVVLSVLVGGQVVYGGQDAVYMALIAGVAAALSVRHNRRRSQILTGAAWVVGAFAITALTIALRVGWDLGDLGSSMARGTANALVSSALVLLLLPVFEAAARVTTDLTLLELSDPSRPLLRRLATEVPGTYAHSVAVANLTEAACNRIGANGLLARVGCYYHDVGKLHRPIHFAENQGPAGNPHDRLPPEMSARIIRDHVTEGLALAEKSRLPDVIKDFIPEHHGTGEITYFLDRARKIGPISEENLVSFRYPGPKPRSAETAVAMLADGVEAVIRVLVEPTDERVRSAIDHVVKQRVDEGQLDDAPLTLGQIEGVKEAFARTLSGMHHNRIEYPAETGGITAHWSAAANA